MVDDTSRSLLERLRVNQDAASWRRLVDLYTPLIRRWLHQYGVAGADVDDFVQEVFRVLIGEIASFQHSGQRGAFRRWLRMTLVNRLRGFWRGRKNGGQIGGEEAERILRELEDPASDPNQVWDREHDEFVARRLLELLEPEFAPSTWQAFRRQVLDGIKPAVAAAELGITRNAALIAKCRVLRRFRQEVEGLVD